MTVNLRKRIAAAHGLLQALRLVQSVPDSAGVFKLKGPIAEGTLAFTHGRITGAAVSPSGERGEAALEKLISMQDSTIRYYKFHDLFPLSQPVDLPLDDYIKKLAASIDAGSTAIKGALTTNASGFETFDADLAGLLNEKAASLSEEQRLLLQSAAKEGNDPLTFQQTGDELQNHTRLTSSQESELRQVASARTTEELRAEFHQPAGWELTEPIEIKGVAELDDAKQMAQGLLDKMPKAEVLPEDRAPMKLMAPKAEHSEPKQYRDVIARVGLYAHSKWARDTTNSPAGRRLSAGTVLGIACLCALAVSIVIVPMNIKNSAGGPTAEQRARERLKQSIHEDLSEDLPQESAQLTPNKPPPVVANPSSDGASGGGDEFVSEELRFGRWLVSKGKLEASIPYYEAYIQQVPDAIKARIELINIAIATKQSHKARLLCIKTLKKKLDSADIATIWSLLGQCQTGN